MKFITRFNLFDLHIVESIRSHAMNGLHPTPKWKQKMIIYRNVSWWWWPLRWVCDKRHPILLSRYWPWIECTSTWLMTAETIRCQIERFGKKYANSIEIQHQMKDFSEMTSFYCVRAAAHCARPIEITTATCVRWWAHMSNFDQTIRAQKRKNTHEKFTAEVHCPSDSALSNVTAGNRQTTSRQWWQCMMHSAMKRNENLKNIKIDAFAWGTQ